MNKEAEQLLANMIQGTYRQGWADCLQELGKTCYIPTTFNVLKVMDKMPGYNAHIGKGLAEAFALSTPMKG